MRILIFLGLNRPEDDFDFIKNNKELDLEVIKMGQLVPRGNYELVIAHSFGCIHALNSGFRGVNMIFIEPTTHHTRHYVESRAPQFLSYLDSTPIDTCNNITILTHSISPTAISTICLEPEIIYLPLSRTRHSRHNAHKIHPDIIRELILGKSSR